MSFCFIFAPSNFPISIFHFPFEYRALSTAGSVCLAFPSFGKAMSAQICAHKICHNISKKVLRFWDKLAENSGK